MWLFYSHVCGLLAGRSCFSAILYIYKSFYSCFVSIPKSPVSFFKRGAACQACVPFGGVQSRLEPKPLCHGSGRERVSIKVNLPQPLRKCAGGVWALVPTSGGGTHAGGSQAMMLMMTAALTSSPRVSLPLFLTARRLSLIGPPRSRDLMLYFSLSRRQLRSVPCFPFGSTLILRPYMRTCAATARQAAHSSRGK